MAPVDQYRAWAGDAADALRECQWFRASGLIGPAGLVNDGLTADCANNGQTTWTYNQGVVIGGLAVLYEITGDDACLGQAEAIAAAALRDLTVPPGILTEPAERLTARRDRDRPQFKGIFVRYLNAAVGVAEPGEPGTPDRTPGPARPP